MKVFDRLLERLALTEEERLLVESVRALARDKLAPRAAHHDATGQFPWENVRDLNGLGLNAMFIPDAYGGAQMSYTAYLECVRQISKACAATGIIWATNFHTVKPVIDFGTEQSSGSCGTPRSLKSGRAPTRFIGS